MNKTQYSTALQNAVKFLKAQEKIFRDAEISTKTGFSKGTVSSYLSGKHEPSTNFMNKFEQVFNLDLDQFAGEIPIPVANPESVAIGILMRIEAQGRVNGSYIAEVYGALAKQPVSKVLRDMERMVEADTLSSLEKLKGK